MIAEFFGGPNDGGALYIEKLEADYITHSEGAYLAIDPDGVQSLVMDIPLRNVYHLVTVECGIAKYKFVRTEK